MKRRSEGLICLVLFVVLVFSIINTGVTYCETVDAKGATCINTFKSDIQGDNGDNNNDGPKTGDELNIRLWTILFLLSLIALMSIITYDRKKNNSKHARK